jgi:hypothetical protein
MTRREHDARERQRKLRVREEEALRAAREKEESSPEPVQ